jgi:signal transduction histidine kinase
MAVDTDGEILGLRTALRDLVALSALPAAWVGRGPPAVAAGLADALVELLQLDFASVRLCDPSGAGAVDVTRGNAWKTFPEWLERHHATSGPLSGKEIIPAVDGSAEPCRGVVVPLGVHAERGIVAAACGRSDFPTEIEQLLLSLAANHAATAFQSARLIQERLSAEEELRKARNELEVKVVDRTAELRRSEAYEAALRRVATLVARGVRPADVFAAVAVEIHELLEADVAGVMRYEEDSTGTIVSVSDADMKFPVGMRMPLGGGVAESILRTGGPASIESYEDTSGPLAAQFSARGIRTGVGTPIVVEGRIWGVTVAAWREQQPEHVLRDAETRLTRFTDLVATAIANADSRAELTASRARVVTAGAEERRRVVRDLHDGAQQRLVHVLISLKLALQELANGRQVGSLVGEALDHAEKANSELRELSHGILPGVLTRGGLHAGVAELVERCALPVAVDISTQRFSPAIEATAYFVVSEALTNAIKHAGAQAAEVNCTVEGSVLRVEVRDDGVGGADPAKGSGIIGLRDRVEALGGTIEIASPSGGGTALLARIPIAGS